MIMCLTSHMLKNERHVFLTIDVLERNNSSILFRATIHTTCVVFVICCTECAAFQNLASFQVLILTEGCQIISCVVKDDMMNYLLEEHRIKNDKRKSYQT